MHNVKRPLDEDRAAVCNVDESVVMDVEASVVMK